MPPSIKVDEQAILQAAFEIVKEKGPEAITARNIASKLRCSTHPIFREYENMEALKMELFEFTNRYFEQYILTPSDNGNPFFNIGFRYVLFAKEEKNLFKMMFMSGCIQSGNLVDMVTSDDNINIMKAIPNFANYSESQIKDLFTKIAVFTHGMASLVATNDIDFDAQRISELLTSLFVALEKNIQRENQL